MSRRKARVKILMDVFGLGLHKGDIVDVEIDDHGDGYGPFAFHYESSSTGFCTCGWSESASSQREVRNEYRFHLRAAREEYEAKEQAMRTRTITEDDLNKASEMFHDHPSLPSSCERWQKHYGTRCPCEKAEWVREVKQHRDKADASKFM